MENKRLFHPTSKMQNVIASHWVHNSIVDPWDTGRSNASKRCGCFMMILSSQEITSNLSTNPLVRLQSFHLNQIHHNLQWISMDHFKGSLLFCFYTCFADLSSSCHGKLLQCNGCRDLERRRVSQGNHPTKKIYKIYKFSVKISSSPLYSLMNWCLGLWYPLNVFLVSRLQCCLPPCQEKWLQSNRHNLQGCRLRTHQFVTPHTILKLEHQPFFLTYLGENAAEVNEVLI